MHWQNWLPASSLCRYLFNFCFISLSNFCFRGGSLSGVNLETKFLKGIYPADDISMLCYSVITETVSMVKPCLESALNSLPLQHSFCTHQSSAVITHSLPSTINFKTVTVWSQIASCEQCPHYFAKSFFCGDCDRLNISNLLLHKSVHLLNLLQLMWWVFNCWCLYSTDGVL